MFMVPLTKTPYKQRDDELLRLAREQTKWSRHGPLDVLFQ
jgi:hypothetical protein